MPSDPSLLLLLLLLLSCFIAGVVAAGVAAAAAVAPGVAAEISDVAPSRLAPEGARPSALHSTPLGSASTALCSSFFFAAAAAAGGGGHGEQPEGERHTR